MPSIPASGIINGRFKVNEMFKYQIKYSLCTKSNNVRGRESLSNYFFADGPMFTLSMKTLTSVSAKAKESSERFTFPVD